MWDVIRQCDLDSTHIPRQKIQPGRGRGLGAVVRPCGLDLPRVISKMAAEQSPIGQGRPNGRADRGPARTAVCSSHVPSLRNNCAQSLQRRAWRITMVGSCIAGQHRSPQGPRIRTRRLTEISPFWLGFSGHRALNYHLHPIDSYPRCRKYSPPHLHFSTHIKIRCALPSPPGSSSLHPFPHFRPGGQHRSLTTRGASAFIAVDN